MPRSNMSHRFSDLPPSQVPRSAFDRSHSYKTTFQAGDLIPIYYDECLPGDVHRINGNLFARMATPIHPLMDNLYIDTQFFFVPNRILWDNWEKFCGAQDDPGDSIDFVVPQVSSISTGYANGTIFDYLGLPTEVALSFNHSAFYCRAYNRIWNDWYRDQNLQDSATVLTDDGPDSYSHYALRKRGKRHDYFTSALPWPQKGESIPLPLGTEAPVLGIGTASASYESTSDINPYQSNQSNSLTFTAWRRFDTTINYMEMAPDATPSYPNIRADLTNATSSTINELRQAITIQQMMERDARSGTRYPEVIKAHFGVISPDFRVQRPEYIGGGSTPISIQSVPQTGETGTTPQGNLAAYATAAGTNHGCTYAATEHGVIMGLASVRADLTYQKGIHRSWSRSTRYDFYWPTFANLGEQAILSKEIYFDTDSTANETVFGYQEAWADYRYKDSMITGQFRSNYAQSLDVWHLSQDFSTRPTLSSDFIKEEPPMDRVLAVPSEPDFILDAWFDVRSARPMPVYGVPGLSRF